MGLHINDARGVTLLELSITLILIGLLLENLWISSSEISVKKQLYAESSKLFRELQNSRLVSDIERAEHKIVLGRSEYKIYRSGVLYKEISFKNSVEFENSSQGKSVIFYSNNVSSPKSIITELKGLKCLITISLRGRINLDC